MTSDPKKAGPLEGLALAQKDGIVNYVSGLGSSRDKSYYNIWGDCPPLDTGTLEALYSGSVLARLIVDKLCDDSFREGFRVVRESGEELDKDDCRALELKWSSLQKGEQRFLRGWKWGRLFGGGGLILGVNGAGAMSTPLKDERVSEVKYLIDWNRQELVAETFELDGSVRTYLWTPLRQGPTNLQVVRIHASRVIIFPGASTTPLSRSQNQWWDLSVLQAVADILKSYEAMWASTDAQFADASQSVIKLQGLIQALAEDGGGAADVKTRLALMDMGRSAAKSLILDAGDETGAGAESYEVVERGSLGGLDKVQQNYFTRLAAAAETPESILLGTAPGGDSATGDLERAMWFGRCDQQRRQVAEERLIRIVRMCAQELGISDPDTLKIEWPELEKMSPLDKATTSKLATDSAVALVSAQVLLPEEVALNLGKLSQGNMNLSINTQARETAMVAALEEVSNREIGLSKMEAEAELSTAQEVKVAKAAPKPAATGSAPSKRKTVSKVTGGAKQG